jgi:hypothetical protein
MPLEDAARLGALVQGVAARVTEAIGGRAPVSGS